MKYLYRIYQYLIALPIFALITIFTAVTTIIFQHWRNSWWLHAIQAFWSRSFFYLLFLPVRVTGLENIDSHTSYVFVANHQSMADVFLIYGWLPVIFKWLMKAELRKVPFIGSGCKAAGHIFVHDGVCTVIFPEGTRSENGQTGRFKRGALQIALDLKLPIVPISLSGCYEVMNRHEFHANWHPVHMHVGKPIDISTLAEEDVPTAIEQLREAVIQGLDTN